LSGGKHHGDPGVAYDKRYFYDAAGNRTRMIADNVQTDYTYDAANKMLTAGNSTFTYDDAGNTLTETNGSVVTTYTWNYLNRLTQWSKTGHTTQSYVYNADGMRVRVVPSSGTATDFLLGGIEIAEEIASAGVTSYVGPGLISSISGTARTIYHADGLGSTRAISGSSQVVSESGVYDAYGNAVATYGTAPSFGYAGQYRYYTDSTGLHYLKARYYDPLAGRFLSRDPIGYDGGLNIYAYVDNRPTAFVDPFGFMPEEVESCAVKKDPCKSKDSKVDCELCQDKNYKNCLKKKHPGLCYACAVACENMCTDSNNDGEKVNLCWKICIKAGGKVRK
jgi:RHS repeat-associated protein